MFLHPPQAKRVGAFVSEIVQSKTVKQIIIATHSPDIIQGVLDSPSNVAIIRINRYGNVNHAYKLDGNAIRKLWQKPLLRSVGAIRGLFHEGVIVCEADADVRFYESLMRRVDKQPADFYFVHGGGKGELATLATSYKAMRIPTAVVADFDILKDKNELKKLVETLGGDFTELEKLYNSVSSALTQAGSKRPKHEVTQDIRDLIDEIERADKITNQHKVKLNRLLGDGRDWSRAKDQGRGALRGQPRTQCDSLLGEFQKLGLFVVPEGEIESWDPYLNTDKNRWILDALEKIDADKSSFTEATEFVADIAEYLWSQ